jgi:hypothetical protein
VDVFSFCLPILFYVFQGPTSKLAIPAPVGTIPASWIATRCPLCERIGATCQPMSFKEGCPIEQSGNLSAGLKTGRTPMFDPDAGMPRFNRGLAYIGVLIQTDGCIRICTRDLRFRSVHTSFLLAEIRATSIMRCALEGVTRLDSSFRHP